MKKLLCVFGAAVLLAACAASPDVAQADAKAHAACRDVDPPIGSHMVKRSDCGAASSVNSASNADAARRDVQMLQQGQMLRTNPPKQ
jgi:opacity protein-like surface antigen